MPPPIQGNLMGAYRTKLGEFEGASAPSPIPPLPLAKGKGIQGMGLGEIDRW
jgi:hypothetical protein